MSVRWQIVILGLLATAVSARDKFSTRTPLNEDDSIWLGGSSLAVVRHPAPWPRVNTITGAIFGGGILGMSRFNAFQEAKASDPSSVFEREFVPLLARQFGVAPVAQESSLVKGGEWADVAAAPTAATYLLDLRTTRLAIDYRRNLQNEYWVGYGVRVALVERTTARPLFVSDCYTDTVDHPDSPRLKDLNANDARLLQDVMTSLAWKCLQKIAGALVPSPGGIPQPPRNLLDPLADYARTHPRE